MSEWHYQVMKKDDTYVICEFFPEVPVDLDCTIYKDGWSEPESLYGESLEDLKQTLQWMLDDIEKYGVRDYYTGELLDVSSNT